MGLDTVELIMAIEEEFGVDIPDKTAEKIFTVGDVYEFLKAHVATSDPGVCLTQQVFYKLRRALIENYGLRRHEIKLDTRMTDLMPLKDIEEGWPFLEMFIELKTPPFRVAMATILWPRIENLTMRDLIQYLIHINEKTLVPKRDSDEELWFRLVKVFVKQLNVHPHEVRYEASIARDLGVD